MAINEQDYAGYAIDPKTGRRHEIRHLPEQDSWEAGIYQTEQGDFFIGGVNGLDNLAINQLTNRTLFLKNRLSEVASYVPSTYELSIPANGWVEEAKGAYRYRLTLPNENVRANAPLHIHLLPESEEAAGLCGFSSLVLSGDGTITFYAKAKPRTAIAARLTVFISKGGGGGGAAMPIATKSTLGAVKIGDGLNVLANGTLSVNQEQVMTDGDLVDEEEVQRDVERILHDD